jgi:hypothetical protein
MLIQNNGRRLRRGNGCPCLEGFKERHEVFGTLFQFDGMGCAVHRNESASHGWRVLETSQDIPGKGYLNLLLSAYAARSNTHRGFVTVFAKHRGPLDPGQDTTICCQLIHLETGIDQHRVSLAKVLQRVGVDIRVCVL